MTVLVTYTTTTGAGLLVQAVGPSGQVARRRWSWRTLRERTWPDRPGRGAWAFTAASELAYEYGRALAHLWGVEGVRVSRWNGSPFGITDAERQAGGRVAVEVIPVQPRPPRVVPRCDCGERLNARYPNLLNVPPPDGKRCEWCRWAEAHHPDLLPVVEVTNPDPDAF